MMLCYNYSKDFEQKHVDLIFLYAKDDINKGLFTWNLFIDGFKQAGRSCDFFPTYSRIIKEVDSLKIKSKYQTVKVDGLLTDGEVVSPKQAKDFLNKIREKLSKSL